MAQYFWIMIVALSVICFGCIPKTAYKEIVENTDCREHYYPVKVENYKSNREKFILNFYKKPTKVVANQQNTIETLLALQQDDTIIAASCTSNHTTEFLKEYESRAKKLPTLSKHDFDIETILMLNPDLIIGWQSTFNNRSLRSTDFWQERNINTYIVENSNSILLKGTIEDEYKFIKNMGKIFNAQSLSEQMVRDIEYEIDSTILQIPNLPKQKVLILEFMGNAISVYGKHRLAGDMVLKLGGELLECGSRIGIEDLLQLDPDVIFVVCIGSDDAQECVNKLLDNKIYRSLKAVKYRRVYAVPLMYIYASSTRTLDGIKTLKSGLYPNLKGSSNAF